MAADIRQPINVQSLERYIEKHVPEIKTPLGVKQFGYGQSNPTYQLTDAAGRKYVMRKKPPGQLLSKTAHRVDREYRIIHALEKTDVPVPKTYCLCEDESVIETPFYIMEFLDGRIFEDPSLPEVSAEERAEMWKAAVETLAKFHRVSPKSVGMESFGKANGFYNRQLATFNTISAAQAKAVDVDTKVAVGEIPHFKDMVAFFSDSATQPEDRSTFVHGDYKIDNVVFHKTEPRVIGILDWEMSTIGHPLSDLANLLTPFTTASSSDVQFHPKQDMATSSAFMPGKMPGLPTKEQCIRWYREVAGWDPMPDITWGEAFGLYRGSIIMQGIAARFALRQASSARAKEYGDKMAPFAEVAWAKVDDCRREKGKRTSGEKARL